MFRLLSTLLVVVVLATGGLRAQSITHPLDPLNWQEYWTTLDVLNEAGHLTDETVFPTVHLREPAKDVVLSWKVGDPIPRSSFAVLRQGPETHEAVVDLVGRTVISYEHIEGVQSMWTDSEWDKYTDSIKAHPDFIAAMARRGYDDLTFVDCGAGPPGYFALEHQVGRRVARAECHDQRGARSIWTRFIEGVSAVVDMDTGEVIEIVEEDVADVGLITADFDRATIGPAREVPGPMLISQPSGSGFKMNGNFVSWQNWRFHVRSDLRVGLILSLVTYDDGSGQRSVMYQGHLSEIFVPYMDPSFGWYARNFLDAGEYAAGGLAKPLMPGIDCPDHATYIGALVNGESGRPEPRPNTTCIFEREAGDMSWRHVTMPNEGESEGRKRRDLVIRQAVVLGNYDYIFDWVFQQNGSIEVAVGATGIAEAKVVNAADASQDTDERDDAYGRFVQPHVVAVNHDHYFNFRLDLDVDGTVNTVEIDRLVTQQLPEDHPRRSIWVAEPFFPRNESDAQLRINYDRPAIWRVLSTNRTNHVGYPTSFQLMPRKNVNTLLTADDYPRRRAGFIDHHLWVTPYDAQEKYAAGDYPTLSTPDQGLPAYTSRNRSIENTDVVLWYTFGMHHMVRAEDWPVMPVLWHSFEIRPFDFFDSNPAMDLPE
jgi:primary-amine oxidase